MLAGCPHKLGVALGDLRLALLELARAHAALCLDALQKRLAGKQVSCADGAGDRGGRALLGTCMLKVGVGAAQLGDGARAARERIRQLALSELLLALAYYAHALETKTERGAGHGRVIGGAARFLSADQRLQA